MGSGIPPAYRIPDSKLANLRAFLQEAFTPQQFESVLIDSDMRAVADAVGKSGGATSYFRDVVEQLLRENLIQHLLFDQLVAVRPNHESRICDLEQYLLEPEKVEDRQKLLPTVQIDELIDAGPHAGLLSFRLQMQLLDQVDPRLRTPIGLHGDETSLLRATLEHLNQLPGSGMDSALARWLVLASGKAAERGHSGPYRRALEVISGAEYRSAEDLGMRWQHPARNSPLARGILSVDYLALGLEAAASVCWLQVPIYRDGAVQVFADRQPEMVMGTGWLITPSLLVTTFHTVAGSPKNEARDLADVRLQVSTMRCEFDYAAGMESGTVLRGSRLLGWSLKSDTALIRLAGETHREGLRLRSEDQPALQPDEHVSMIHHGFAGPKLLSLRGRVLGVDVLGPLSDLPPHFRAGERLLYDVPSGPGSSGAPLFDDSWHLVGFHLGFLELPGGSGRGRRLEFGTPLTEIWQFIQGVDAEADDDKLFRIALNEIQTKSRRSDALP